MKSFIDLQQVSFSYRQAGRDPLQAVKQISLCVPRGGHIAVLGRNGSGKSTLARLINALELPEEGVVLVAGRDSVIDENIWEIRRLCGMVFQNPDNQIIGTTVEEDVAFGPENLGFPQPEIRAAVDTALAVVDMEELADKPPHLLSGGQKQKLAIAGILAMNPECLILDEATSMLDPVSRREFMTLVESLRHSRGLTVVNITHNMEEVLLADTVYVMSDGEIVVSGTPAEVFDQVRLIRSLGLDIPAHTDIAWDVAQIVGEPLLPMEASTWEKAQQAVLRLLDVSRDKARSGQPPAVPELRSPAVSPMERPVIINVRDLSCTFNPGTSYETRALDHVTFDVRKGELLGIIGHSGSGKSTLIQHLNGLLRSGHGHVQVLGMDASNPADIRKIRQQVGLLFQYPEHQLFEETVFRDIAFGPKRMGLGEEEIRQRVLEAAAIVGIEEDILERSPFELSGGQKRRVAIAGILAMKPDVLILDEPAAGLDPAGRDEILSYADRLCQKGVTVLLVSHSMEDIARLADRILVLKEGHVHAFGLPEVIFSDPASLEATGLSQPRPTLFLQSMRSYLPGLSCQAYQPDAAAACLVRAGLQEVG